MMRLMGVVLVAPLLVVAGISLNEKRVLIFPPQGLSLHWYGELFIDPAWRSALVNSVSIAGLSALLACSVALPVAYAVWRRPGPLARLLNGLAVVPFILPPVITALGFLVFWIAIGFYGSYAAVVISHGIFLVTLPLIAVSLGFSDLDRSLVEAAQTLGADERTLFHTVVIPMVLPYAVTGYAFAFVLSLNEYIISYMVAGFTVETLPIKVFNAIRYGYTPVMAAVSVLFFLVAFAIFSAIGRWGDLPRLLGAWSRKE